MSARVVRFPAFGGPEVLQVDAVDIGQPGPGEVRIAVHAFGLNRVEAMSRAGQYMPVTFPARLGYEAAGVIEALGPGVTGWSVGDRVATLFGLDMERYGTYADTLAYPADMLVPVAPSQSLVEAAASWMQYGTAYALVEIGRIAAGDAVVINAASSSVGLAAIAIANDHGAVPIAVTRGRDKAAALRAAGAAHVIVSDEEDVAARVRELTGGRGAQVAFDAVAGPGLTALMGAMAPKGIVIVYGMLGGYSAELGLLALTGGNLTLRGFAANLLVEEVDSRARLVDYVGSRLASGAFRPTLDRTFALEDIAEAHRRLESNRQVGKIVVTTGRSA
ncbi:MAG: zinc-dependent alcohol dehydrogenase family protein [Sphingomonadales bacterium]|nr:zinc-dependent alcohol dehydrogenase family protein [Sphingomonadales bacterium]